MCWLKKAACKGPKMQVKKELPVEVAHFSRFVGRRTAYGTFWRPLPGHLDFHCNDL
jgi:hypothetical protein